MNKRLKKTKNMKVRKAKIKAKSSQNENHEGIIVTKKKDIVEIKEKFYTELHKSHISESLNPENTITNVGSEEMTDISIEEIRLPLRQMNNRKFPREN